MRINKYDFIIFSYKLNRLKILYICQALWTVTRGTPHQISLLKLTAFHDF
jgi:hypothetical protein